MSEEKSSQYEKYVHHTPEKPVFVRSDLKGKHREHCLCYSCESFKPESGENCPVANALYQYAIRTELVTPVWECPEFKEKAAVIEHNEPEPEPEAESAKAE